MPEPNDSFRPDDDAELSSMSDEPYEQEPAAADDDSPRRAASARFVVDSNLGSDAVMRSAMDPANQSLAEALRLSFRVLQAVILVLVVLFLASGFQTVDDGQSGVRTVWGKIVAVDGAEALSPGLQFSIYPYPIAEFVLFKDENNVVDMSSAFAPAPRQNRTHEQMLAEADMRTPLQPGRDGSLLTRDGDLAHLTMTATYAVDSAGDFVRHVNDSDQSRNADKIVDLALRRAAVQVVSESSLQELIDQTDDTRARIQNSAQAALDELDCGIQLTQVQIQRAYAPLAIEKSLGDLQAARVGAAERIDKARQRANETLSKVAGSDYMELISLIDAYEEARERDDDGQATQLLASINAKLDNNDGDVSQIIQMAKAYQSQIESTLGNEYRRFASLLPAYRSNPHLLIRQQWLETYAQVVRQPDAELIYVPDPMMAMTISLTGSSAIQEIRRKADIARRDQQANMSGYGQPDMFRASDMTMSGPSRILDLKDGKAAPRGSSR